MLPVKIKAARRGSLLRFIAFVAAVICISSLLAGEAADTAAPRPVPEIRTQAMSFHWEPGERNAVLVEPVLPGEVAGVTTEEISITGDCSFRQAGGPDTYDVLLTISGTANVISGSNRLETTAEQIIRLPYGADYRIDVPAGDEFKCLRVRKAMTAGDREVIRRDAEMHSFFYARKYSECQAYTEDIKSAKTINRMLLPEGYVPRLCMGLVETAGPDSVGAHVHPMLDQLFLGLKNCRCTCSADGAETLLTENALLHIPLASWHSASVAPGDLLSYIWMDNFFTTQGQSYMSEQHKMVEQEPATGKQ